VQIVGRPEEHRVLAGLDAKSAPDHDTFVGQGVEVERLYLCRAYDAAAAKNVTYAYNAITRQWSRWLIDSQCLTVVGDRILYGLNNSLGHVLQQRDSRRDGDPQYRDMAEESATFVVSSIDSAASTITGTFTDSVDYTGSAYADGLGYGWKIYDGSDQYLVLSSSGSGPYTLTLNTVVGLAGTPTLTMYRPIPVTIEWNPITGGNAGELKQFGEIVVRLETQNAYKVSLQYANEYDLKADPTSTTWVAQPSATDAYVSADQKPASSTTNDFGATPGSVNPNNVIRSVVHRDRVSGCQLQPKITNSVAEARFAVKALVVDARPMSARVKQ
jgi:hypothetical protein